MTGAWINIDLNVCVAYIYIRVALLADVWLVVSKRANLKKTIGWNNYNAEGEVGYNSYLFIK